MGSALGVRKGHAVRLGLTLAEYAAHVDLGEKWCTRCKAWHPSSAFGIDGSRGDGLASSCRASRTSSSDQPGRRERRTKRAAGLAWCRGCSGWLPVGSVRAGVCREHANAEYRARYAAAGEAIRQRVHARKRGIEPLHLVGVEYLTEQFGALCAYCPEIATTWDHVVPIARGGQTTPGNIVPACASCNSSKKTAEVFSWLARTGRIVKPELIDVIALEDAA